MVLNNVPPETEVESFDSRPVNISWEFDLGFFFLGETPRDSSWWNWLPLKHSESPTRFCGNYYLLGTASERCTTFTLVMIY